MDFLSRQEVPGCRECMVSVDERQECDGHFECKMKTIGQGSPEIWAFEIGAWISSWIFLSRQEVPGCRECMVGVDERQECDGHFECKMETIGQGSPEIWAFEIGAWISSWTSCLDRKSLDVGNVWLMWMKGRNVMVILSARWRQSVKGVQRYGLLKLEHGYLPGCGL